MARTEGLNLFENVVGAICRKGLGIIFVIYKKLSKYENIYKDNKISMG